ncbi:MFS transporter [Vagococcus sp. DIV0080]|uniref:MFS transporter n=1 Tax=Candidatus Vagococcus giribetii TaxID=2230876 RepID=A0ABS3HSK5_9ENTE|nr:MFS transporter [Vagococcus sp. DIV0080]MBO0476744.1 MFS transporter [Vagococcus sp. DIV0080]
MDYKINKVTPYAVLSISLILTSGMAINGTLPLIKEQLSLTQTQSELLGTIPSLTVFLFVLFSNVLIDKLGMKRLVLLGLGLVAIGGTLPVIIPGNYTLILLSRLILGAGLGCYNSSSVNYINELFTGKERMTLLGLRNSMESIGQMALTFLSGFLLFFGWRYSYLIYLFAIPIAIIFYLYVPEAKKEEKQEKEAFKPQLISILSVLFASVMVMNSIAIAVRFPGLAVDLKGPSYNTSFFLALMPVLGIVSGFLFQQITSKIKHRILYLAVFINAIANLLMALGQYSFSLLVIGLLISSIPVAWVLPYLFNHIEVIAKGISTRVLTSFIFLGCNIGVLVAPLLMSLIAFIGGTDDLYFPFYVFTALFILILIGLMIGLKNMEKNTTD